MDFPIDGAASDAGILAELLSVTCDIVNDMDYVQPDGRRNRQMDRLHALIFTCEKLAKELTDTVDALPRPEVKA